MEGKYLIRFKDWKKQKRGASGSVQAVGTSLLIAYKNQSYSAMS